MCQHRVATRDEQRELAVVDRLGHQIWRGQFVGVVDWVVV
ncbi:hypothetical protein DB30_00693 [Enhygromyxa salina]|uniref:Uncharacterized protein n=1 Tax=Enhygromyxa salina TaxID=215803 RepID=A0A0C2A4T0_9BACT|nr:hypothetical protein DB30_00693 [Enhygromyxa salina]